MQANNLNDGLAWQLEAYQRLNRAVMGALQPDGDAEDRLAEKGDAILHRIAQAGPDALPVKVAALACILEDVGETAAALAERAETHAERLLWSLARDLMEARDRAA